MVDNLCATTKHVHVAARTRKTARKPENDSRRRHRARVLAALARICEDIEHLQVTAEAKAACRDVRTELGRMLLREQRRERQGGG